VGREDGTGGVTRYQAYVASGSTDPYSVWLSEQWTVFLVERGEKWTPRIVMNVLAETRWEWLARKQAEHRDAFDAWLFARAGAR